jgi:two-component system invasion response regulator UvrY
MHKFYRIGVADACPLFRSGLRALIKRINCSPSFETENAAGLRTLLKSKILDVVIIEPFAQGVGSGLRLLEALNSSFPNVRLLVCTWRSDPDLPMYALRAGSAGFITKNSGEKEIMDALQAVACGKKYFAAEILQQCADVISGKVRFSGKKLSPREREVCEFIAAGNPLVQIAKRLQLSPSTVSTIRSRILEKSSLKSDADLVRYADRLI